jgi:hypothetical protein
MDDKNSKAVASERSKALAAALSQIEKQFGRTSLWICSVSGVRKSPLMPSR